MDDLIPPFSYAPDGLTEADIDAMIAEYFVTVPEQETPSTDRVATHRHVRRIYRQAVNSVLRGRPAA